MFLITQDPSSGSYSLYLVEITYGVSHVPIWNCIWWFTWACYVRDGCLAANCGLWGVCMCVCALRRAENYSIKYKNHMWNTICNFNQIQAITPWWRILCVQRFDGVIFNVFLLDCYTAQILTCTAVSIECISWLIKVTNNIDARWKREALGVACYTSSRHRTRSTQVTDLDYNWKDVAVAWISVIMLV
jgi:hypothetical protein